MLPNRDLFLIDLFSMHFLNISVCVKGTVRLFLSELHPPQVAVDYRAHTGCVASPLYNQGCP